MQILLPVRKNKTGIPFCPPGLFGAFMGICFFWSFPCSADLMGAIKSGNVNEVQEYISSNNILLHARVLGGYTPLETAVDLKQLAVAKFLIEAGADVKEPTPDRATLLHHAAFLNEAEMAGLLIDHGIPVNAPWGWNQRSPLHIAAEKGNMEVAQFLLKHGADVNLASDPFHFNSPLEDAVVNGNLDMIKLLLSHGANCKIRDAIGNSLLHNPGWVRKANGLDPDPNVVDALLACGLDINTPNNYGDTPLHASLPKGFKKESLLIAERMIARGADVNARNQSGQTPLLSVASHGFAKVDTLQMMFAHGADLHVKDDHGETLLHFTSGALTPVPQSKALVEFLLLHGVEINAQDSDGLTPLDIATRSRASDTVDLLKLHGALSQSDLTPIPVVASLPHIPIPTIATTLTKKAFNDCIPLDQAQNIWTPILMYSYVQGCINQSQYELSAQWFALAGVYSAFDAKRVTDISAAEARPALIITLLNGYSEDQKTHFEEATEHLAKTSKLNQKFCEKVHQLGWPHYRPDYMLYHGMQAFLGDPLENGLVKDFDSMTVWNDLQTQYLHCASKLESAGTSTASNGSEINGSARSPSSSRNTFPLDPSQLKTDADIQKEIQREWIQAANTLRPLLEATGHVNANITMETYTIKPREILPSRFIAAIEGSEHEFAVINVHRGPDELLFFMKCFTHLPLSRRDPLKDECAQ
jgi:ankyrin repeat protein